ncbi:hypothetical protein JTB14_035204 [Gonioctena quinquepunctata]|nr:hypothetical protein JTB14_035204 [Gonioctena quinquepunctata]
MLVFVAGSKQLLKSVNGKFCSGELTAIMGPSGAGKTTLLNILAAYVTSGVKGSIEINGQPRQMKLFNKLSSYIMQEDLVQPRLSVRESMEVAVNLKLGSTIAHKQKIAVMEEVIQLLGLEKCYDTMTENLSGGQRKRLIIALELVNNPPVIFLDEPTSGLDNVTIKQCMELLHKITGLGRTVICTIHQPPASLFHNFDQVYVMADGYCVFNGSPSQLVPYMSSANFVCPSTSTPADYIIELVASNPENIRILQNRIQNGKVNLTDEPEQTLLTDENYEKYENIYEETTLSGTSHHDIVFATSFWVQLQILMGRMYKQMKRNKTMLYIQFLHHLLSGSLMGGIFLGIGKDANQMISVVKYCISVNVFFTYTYIMAPVLVFPVEVEMMRREYFNRWYSLKAYFVAVTLVNIPLLVFNTVMFSCIVYFLTDQPWEYSRFSWYIAISLAVALCSQGLGYAVGATFNNLFGSIVAPSLIAILLAFAVYGMGYRNTYEPFMNVLISTSYLRFGFVAISATIFDNRDFLNCEEDYCHYRDTQLLMTDMGMANVNKGYQFLGVLIFSVLFRVIAYMSLKFRMTSVLRDKIIRYALKIVKRNKT